MPIEDNKGFIQQKIKDLSEESKLTCLKIAFELYLSNMSWNTDKDGNVFSPSKDFLGLAAIYRCVTMFLAP